ncbi:MULTISPECIES: fibronectin type III domain-containing protein [Peribacillus]|nr:MULTISPECIES: fibronectin type III domain-containing protein [Peribacillus]MCM3672396.1 fibronectin type III domain-containing protein [Peribacillus simplex]MDQ0881636.1 hypothetical protein [Peribacillus sp. V2I11]
MRIHEAIMEGLTPNTSYTYRIGSAADWSEAYTLLQQK